MKQLTARKTLLTSSKLEKLYSEIKPLYKTNKTLPNFEKKLVDGYSNVNITQDGIVLNFKGNEYLLWDYITKKFH